MGGKGEAQRRGSQRGWEGQRRLGKAALLPPGGRGQKGPPLEGAGEAPG